MFFIAAYLDCSGFPDGVAMLNRCALQSVSLFVILRGICRMSAKSFPPAQSVESLPEVNEVPFSATSWMEVCEPIATRPPFRARRKKVSGK